MTNSPPQSLSPLPASDGHDGSSVRVNTKITVPDHQQLLNLLGARDQVLKSIERVLASDIHVRGNEITITGTPADNALAERVFSELIELIEKGETLTEDAVRRTVGMLQDGTE